MKVVCIGSGNVATHLAQALKSSGADLVQVWSKTLANAEALANVLQARAISDFKDLFRDADLYVISVKDDAIAELVMQLCGLKGMVVHTSGATPLTVFEGSGLQRFGVLYPLQTFSKSRAVDFSVIPLCLEAGDEGTLQDLKALAAGLSREVQVMNSAKRKQLHLAAVYACNFTNHLYHLAGSIIKEHGLSFDLLKPLIMETAEKVQQALPVDVQTGPAVRNDELTMQRHLELISDKPLLTEVYQLLSKSIKKTYL